MKLKMWVQVVLVIISIISIMMMMYDIEISMTPLIVGTIMLVISTYLLCEYGTLQNILKVKLEQLLHK